MALKHLNVRQSYGIVQMVGAIRLTYGQHTIYIEELHAKGKRRLRRFTLNFMDASQGGPGDSAFLAVNILKHHSKVTADMSYDQAVKATKQGIKQASEEVLRSYPDYDLGTWLRTEEDVVGAAKVPPANAGPLDIRGKDFAFTATWTSFKVFQPQDPSMDDYGGDPHYSGYEQSSPQAARLLYRILKTNPAALSKVSFTEFSDWADKNKIRLRHINSVWH